MSEPIIVSAVEGIRAAQPSFGFRLRKDAGSNQNLNGAIYGDYGVGKTFFAGTVERDIQEMNRKTPYIPVLHALPEGVTAQYATLYANSEQGEEGLPVDCPNIMIKDIYTYKDFSHMYDFLKIHCKLAALDDIEGMLKLQANYFKIPAEYNKILFIFKAVIIDSLTEIQKYCVYQLIGLTQDSSLADEPDYMQMRQWGTALEMILLMVRNFRALPMYKVFIIQQTEDTDEKKKLFFRPSLQGQAKSSILGFFDFVGYYMMSVKEDGILRRMYLLPVGPWKAKHRFESFRSNFLDNPTMHDILQFRLGVEPPVVPAKKTTVAKPGIK